MEKTYSIIGIGIITLIFGLIFHLQGQSVIGPESSFMYANPNWITYGIEIMICGNHNNWNRHHIRNFKNKKN